MIIQGSVMPKTGAAALVGVGILSAVFFVLWQRRTVAEKHGQAGAIMGLRG